jgi:hypothetical protein
MTPQNLTLFGFVVLSFPDHLPTSLADEPSLVSRPRQPSYTIPTNWFQASDIVCTITFIFTRIPLRLDPLLLCGKPILTRPITPLISSLSAFGRCDNCLLIFPLVRIRQMLRDLLMLTCAFAACWRYCMGNHHHRGSPFFLRPHVPPQCLIDRSIIITLQLYSTVGGILLYKDGPFLFFVYPEWYGIVSTL